MRKTVQTRSKTNLTGESHVTVGAHNFTRSALQNSALDGRLWPTVFNRQLGQSMQAVSFRPVLDLWVFCVQPGRGRQSFITFKHFACTLTSHSFFSLFYPLVYMPSLHIFVTFLCMFLGNSILHSPRNRLFDLAVSVAYLRRQERGDQASGPSQSLVSRWDLAPGPLGTWKT